MLHCCPACARARLFLIIIQNNFAIRHLLRPNVCVARTLCATAELNGHMQLQQNGARLLDESVARDQAVGQEIVLRDADYASIANASAIVVHWFVDCNYVQRSRELHSAYTFAAANRTHHIEALVEVTLDTERTAQEIPPLKSRLISDWQTTHQPRLPFVCGNRSGVAPDEDKIYGHFAKNVTVFGRADNISICILSTLTFLHFFAFSLHIFAHFCTFVHICGHFCTFFAHLCIF